MKHISNLLWTGGWDSTYRLLELLLVENKSVQTYYVIDSNRASTAIELQTMQLLRDSILQKNPKAKNRFPESRIIKLEDIKPNQEITERYWRMANKERLGIQYEWLARLALQFGIDNLQLSVERRPDSFMGRHVYPFLKREEPENRRSYRLKEEPVNPDVHFFGKFEYPLIELTKQDMRALAIKYKFENIMNHTWFCHKPTKSKKSCGVCVPCSLVIKDGMGYRLPLSSRARHFFEFGIKRPIKQLVKPS
ncbi:7-cyano-7-deazaguanine synthase [Pontibacter vulgaris]|uniref:7-cyano-7-deazaguanine synthase n=1 Tax=Pontibacter vulgaris TaxID=2905679 RepID=UPI001FA6D83A|nr:7-cyano-7-deazaguanine synthase [Pontibacter vulgaris]